MNKRKNSTGAANLAVVAFDEPPPFSVDGTELDPLPVPAK